MTAIGSRSLQEKLRDGIRETAEAGLILDRHMHMLLRELEAGSLDFRVPQKVTARIVSSDDPEYGFNMLWCSACSRICTFELARESRLRCPNCQAQLSQAPAFVANYDDRPPTPVPFSEVVRKVTHDANVRYCIYTGAPMHSGQRLPRETYKGLRVTNRDRPIDSLCWVCPIPQETCTWRDNLGYCKYSYYDPSTRRGRGTQAGRPYRPDLQVGTERIRLVPPPFGARRTAFGTFLGRYRPITMSEGITKPVRVAVHSFVTGDAERLAFQSDELRGIQDIMFVRRLEILQFTIAIAIGLPYVGIRRRPVVLLHDTTPDGHEQYYLLSRRLVTQGLVIRLRPNVVQHIVDDWTQRRPGVARSAIATTLYHTVAHALLRPLPMTAGLDASEFSESFSANDNEIAVYDNSPGGIGGVKTLVEEGTTGPSFRRDYSSQLLGSTDCQLDCSWSCKACMHIGSCGWINRQLQRGMLEEIVDEHLRNRYFVN